MVRLLTCSCGEKTVVAKSQAGQAIICKACGTSNQVPSLRGLESLPLADGADTSSSPANLWRVRGPVMALCLAGVLLCGAYAGYEYYLAYSIQVPYSTEQHIADETRGIDAASIDELLTYWDGYSKTKMTNRMPTVYKVRNDFAAKSRRTSTIFGACSLALGVIALATFASAGLAKKA